MPTDRELAREAVRETRKNRVVGFLCHLVASVAIWLGSDNWLYGLATLAICIGYDSLISAKMSYDLILTIGKDARDAD